MQVDEALVRSIARLARIRIEKKQVPALQQELVSILGWVEQLNDIDTTNVEPMTGATCMKLRQRKDDVTDGGIPEDIVRNAPMSEDNFFVVPKVVE
jgi:aspartyl/glutamyl-tRNA(Asn/Gln) amidotransferase subunit C (EC 6.3.5.-)